MQRLISVKLALNLSKTLSSSTTTTTTTSSSLCYFQPHKTFSLTKLAQTQTQNHFLSSFPTHPLRLTRKVHDFLSNPSLRRHFLLGSANTLLRVLSKRLWDCRLAFLQTQFPKQRFQIIPSSNSRESARILYPLNPIFLYDNFTTSLYNFMLGHVHTMITPAITHADVGHMVFNMIGLYYFGRNIGRVFGPEFLLKLYLAGAIGGSVFYLVHHTFLNLITPTEGRKENISIKPKLGASCAVNAITLLDIFLQPTVPAVLLGIFLIGKDIPRIMEGNIHVSGSRHLGGAAVAAIASVRLRMGLQVF